MPNERRCRKKLLLLLSLVQHHVASLVAAPAEAFTLLRSSLLTSSCGAPSFWFLFDLLCISVLRM
jgi:hypothetical protein